jgi:outer membrane protein
MPSNHFNPTFSASKLVASVGLTLLASAQAQTSRPAPTNDWAVNVGAAGVFGPRFPGASESKTTLVPVIDARYKNYLFISPIRGIGIDLQLAEGLTGSAAVGIDLTSREEKESPRLVGLGDVNAAGALLLGLDYRLGDVFAKAGLSSRLGSDSQSGTSFDLDLGYNLMKSQALILGAGLNLRAMDNTYASNFFGVNPQQSAASKLPGFKANGGLQSAGAFANAFYRIDNQWSLFSRLNLYQLQGDAADSPVVRQKDQSTFVLGVTRAL